MRFLDGCQMQVWFSCRKHVRLTTLYPTQPRQMDIRQRAECERCWPSTSFASFAPATRRLRDPTRRPGTSLRQWPDSVLAWLGSGFRTNAARTGSDRSKNVELWQHRHPRNSRFTQLPRVMLGIGWINPSCLQAEYCKRLLIPFTGARLVL